MPTSHKDMMAALIDAINVKRKTLFELDNIPFYCLEAEVNTPTARGGQTLVRLKMRNLLTSAVFEKTFKANDKFKEPDLQLVPASYLYSDNEGSYFLDQESYETVTLAREAIGNALDVLIEGTLIQLHKYNGNEEWSPDLQARLQLGRFGHTSTGRRPALRVPCRPQPAQQTSVAVNQCNSRRKAF